MSRASPTPYLDHISHLAPTKWNPYGCLFITSLHLLHSVIASKIFFMIRWTYGFFIFV